VLRKVSDYLRLCRDEMGDAGPEVAEMNKTDINGDPLPGKGEGAEGTPESGEECPEGGKGPGAPMKPGTFEEMPRPTAGPNIRAPRRQRAHHRKWNPETRRQRMREYMRGYRGTGRINERKTQTRGA